jgi:hypothetical protein
MKIDPEAAVKLEDGQRSVREIALRLGCGGTGSKQRECDKKNRDSYWRSSRHG